MNTGITKFLFICTLVCGVFTSPAFAQGTTPDLKLDFITVDELPQGRKVLINTGYALKFNVPVPEAFSIFVPEVEGITAFPETADSPDVPLFKVTYVGKDSENPDNIFLVENIMFFNMDIALGPLEKRINELGQFLAQQVFPSITSSFEQANYIGGGAIKIGELDAVEIIGSYQDPQNGEMGVRIVGVLHPNSADGVFSISNIVTKFYSLTGPNDLALTTTAALMREFTYLGN